MSYGIPQTKEALAALGVPARLIPELVHGA
jgi:hypothetical protein